MSVPCSVISEVSEEVHRATMLEKEKLFIEQNTRMLAESADNEFREMDDLTKRFVEVVTTTPPSIINVQKSSLSQKSLKCSRRGRKGIPIQKPNKRSFVTRLVTSRNCSAEGFNNALDYGFERVNEKSAAESLMVTWILQNFEPSEGSSLKRSVLYDFYREHCVEKGMEPINPASFGKLIRSVFVGIKTRRLGTRGNSKYHYYGVKVSDASPLKQRFDIREMENDEYQAHCLNQISSHRNHSRQKMDVGCITKSEPMYYDTYDGVPGMVTETHFPPSLPVLSQHGNGATSYYDELFHPDDECTKFLIAYKSHLQLILNAVMEKQFASIEYIVSAFWSGSSAPPALAVTHQMQGSMQEQPLSPDQLSNILTSRTVLKTLKLMERKNNLMISRNLIPDLTTNLCEDWRRSIHSFVGDFTEWTRVAILSCPSELKLIKAHTMFHLCALIEDRLQANLLLHCFALSVQTQETLNAMRTAFESVNRHTISMLVDWCIDHDDTFNANMDTMIIAFLSGRQSLDRCIHVLITYCNAFVNRYDTLEPDQIRHSAKRVLSNWSVYAATILRFLYIQKAEYFERFNTLLTALGNCVNQEMMFRYEMAYNNSEVAAQQPQQFAQAPLFFHGTANQHQPILYQQEQQQQQQSSMNFMQSQQQQQPQQNSPPAIKRPRFATE